MVERFVAVNSVVQNAVWQFGTKIIIFARNGAGAQNLPGWG